MDAKILNNPKKMEKIDPSSMLSFCVETPKHLDEALKLTESVSIDYSKPKTIVVSGMGGSAIGGELLKDWAKGKIEVPIEICRDYSLPSYVNEDTLVFVISYSGETEETLSMFSDAVKKNCMTFCISSGGSLSEYAEKLDIPLLSIPSGIPPRAALPYLFLPQLKILENIGSVSSIESEISEALNVLSQAVEDNHPKVMVNQNFSKEMAIQIKQTVPIVYGFGSYRAVAQRYKQQFNENSKVPAKWDFFPEICHNEIEGWEASKKLTECFSPIFIRGDDEPPMIKGRINAIKELISDKTEKIFEVWSVGKSRLAKMLSLVSIADFTSVYLAILRGVDPTPVKSISILKKRISRTGAKDQILRELHKLSKG